MPFQSYLDSSVSKDDHVFDAPALAAREDLVYRIVPFSMFMGTTTADPAVTDVVEEALSILDKVTGAVFLAKWRGLGVQPEEYRAAVESIVRRHKKLKNHVVEAALTEAPEGFSPWLVLTVCLPGQAPELSCYPHLQEVAGPEEDGDSIISFFTGAGFLDLGFEKAGFRVDMVNEYEREFLAGYRYAREAIGSPAPRYGHHLGSAEEMASGDNLERLARIVGDIQSEGRRVGFVGGPPCPDFSIGGKQAGSEGENGRLTDVYFDVIIGARPDFFIFENVEGLWKTKRHRKFYDEMKDRAAAAGYVLHDRLINAVEYGVGQSRPRIFLVGVLDGAADAVFPWEENMTHSKSVLDLDWPHTDPFGERAERPFPADRGIPEELTVEHWFRRNEVASHANARMSFVPKSDKISEVPEGMTDHKSFKRLHRWRYSPTACYGNNEVHLHPYLPRRISVAEALALQSMPREFSLPTDMPLSKAFKTIGNGVPFLAALGLARSVASVLGRRVAAQLQEAA